MNTSDPVKAVDAQILEQANCLRRSVGLIDLNHRDRICLVGNDRARFLNGQVTNNIRDLAPGQGCYTLTVSNKGHIEGDAQVYCLPDELLVDLEPGHGPELMKRLNQFIISDDVELIDVSQQFGLISLQGPSSRQVLEAAALGDTESIPSKPNAITLFRKTEGEEVYLAQHSRTKSDGYDLFIAQEHLPTVTQQLEQQVHADGGMVCGQSSLDVLRIEAGIPRYPNDMTPSVLAPELGNTDRTISYTKGCYIGQEIINRIKSIGKVNRRLMGFQVAAPNPAPVPIGAALYAGDKSVGSVSSATFSGSFNTWIGLALVKQNAMGESGTVEIRSAEFTDGIPAILRELPFSTSESGSETS